MTTEAVEPALEKALGRRILTLADSKRLLGIRYSDWLLGAPSIETGIAASSMAQDEWGHARLLYALLKDLGLDPRQVEHERPAAEYASLDPLDAQLPDWAALVAAIVVVDGAVSAALAGLAEGGWEPARARVPKMLLEEAFHRDLGNAWFHRLSSSAGAREALAGHVRSMLPRTLAWLDPADDPHAALCSEGVLVGDARRSFLEAVADVLDAAGVDAASAEPARDGWDEARARGPGHPDEDAVERARGDRNRALMVE